MGILGIDNRNVLNLKQPYAGGTWFGGRKTDSRGHAIFDDWIYGIRGSLRNLFKKTQNGKNTPIEIIADWAPINDPHAHNNPSEYCHIVLDEMLSSGFPWKADQVLPIYSSSGAIVNKKLLFALMAGMAQVEIYRGFRLEELPWESSVALYYATNVVKSIDPS